MEIDNFQSKKQQCEIVANYSFNKYNELPDDIQNLLSSALSNLMIENSEIFKKCSFHYEEFKQSEITKLFELNDIQGLVKRFKFYSSVQILKFHCQACLMYPNLAEEGLTLFQTLHPFIKDVTSFEDLDIDFNKVLIKMLMTLTRHLSDSDLSLSKGLIALVIRIKPSSIIKHIDNVQSIKNFQNYLKDRTFSLNEQEIIKSNFQKFLFPNFIDLLLQITQDLREGIIQLISISKVVQDPGNSLKEFQKVFNQRKLILEILIKKPIINLQIERVLDIVIKIKDFEKHDICKILNLKEEQWMREIDSILSGDIQIIQQQVISERVNEIYDKSTKNINKDKIITIDEITNCSHKMVELCPQYRHSEYQSAVAAASLSVEHSIVQIMMPTASGKTWVQGLISSFFIQKGKQVLSIVANNILKYQMKQQLQSLGIGLQIITILEFYSQKHDYDVLLIDEFDAIVKNNPWREFDGKILGIWDFSLTKTFMFSATCDIGVERILEQVCIKPQKLKFISEYELINGIKQDQGGEIIVCQDYKERIQQLIKIITQQSQIRPIIIFTDEQNIGEIEKLIQTMKHIKVKKSLSIDLLEEIQSWESGILILSPKESFGHNCKFRQDALVIIATNVDSESLYQQMRGRSSRKMGALLSIYLPISKLNKEQILANMAKLQMNQLEEFEILTKLIYRKRKCKSLIEAVRESQKNSQMIMSLKDLKEEMGLEEYKKLMSK